MPGTSRTYESDRYSLVLDGINNGFIKSFEGGNVSAEVISEPSGPDFYFKKHIGIPRYEDFTIQIGLSMGVPVYQWISASWAGTHQRKDGSIVAADFKLEAESEREFFNALLTETTIPACDGASKDPAYITLKFSPEYVRVTKASKKQAEVASKDKIWLAANFKLAIDGLDCSKVSKIDSFTVKQSATRDEIGEARDYLREPAKLEFPNLRITLSEASAQSWYAWHEDFVIRGNNGIGQEKNGCLTLFSPNGQTELATISFFNLGIFKLAPEKRGTGQSPGRRMIAELYCERMEFAYTAAK